MIDKEKKYYETYLKIYGKENSMIGRMVKNILDQESRIIALEKKT